MAFIQKTIIIIYKKERDYEVNHKDILQRTTLNISIKTLVLSQTQI